MFRLMRAPRETSIKFDGEHSRRWWSTRDESTSSAPGYWDTRTHPARKHIAKTLCRLGAASLLEIGCHACANLAAAAEEQKWDRMVGTELSPTVIAYAADTVQKVLPVEIVKTAADNLPFRDGEFDVILTSVTLVCIGPQEIERSLAEIARVSARWIVLAEPIENDPRFGTATGREDPYPNTMYWIRDYATMLAPVARRVSVECLDADAQLGHLNSISVFEKR